MTLKFSQAVTPITDFKARSREIVERLRETGKPVLITQRGRVTAILESIESYEKKQERYDAIEGILLALREAEEGKLVSHQKALEILESF